MVSSAIRSFRETEKNKKNDFTFFVNLDPELYISLLYNARCLIGNSSSFIREGSQMGKPAVILGERQKGREVGKNVIFSNYDQDQIIKNLKNSDKKRNLNVKRSMEMGQLEKIVKILEQIKPKLKGQISY